MSIVAEKHYKDQLNDILDFVEAQATLSDLLPSSWAEMHRIMSTDVSPFPGPFSYDTTPYLREIVDFLSPNHPGHRGAVMKGAQLGFSTGVLENGMGWIIAQNPGNILFLTGHPDLAEEAMNKKIDQMIDSCGLRPLIRPTIMRRKNQRTGDTSKSKEFPGGSLIAGSASNHKLLRQRSIQFGFIDDFDSAKKSSKESGNTRRLIEQRFAAYHDKMKLLYISTPELKLNSNIEPVFLLGDQRRWHIPCPCCGVYIPLYWQVALKGTNGKQMAGITWRLDKTNKLDIDSVGYTCQECGDFFDESLKREFLNAGKFVPMAEQSEIGYYSWHISSLYAPPGMYGWEYYVRQYLEANPKGGARKEDLHKTFLNLALGETYEQSGVSPGANAIQGNIRGYKIGEVPELMSEKDGNGKIVMLTCAADLNGVELDARLDYEVTAWSATGSSYSIKHGSIGTFIPREGAMRVKVDRERWTYEHNRHRSVWPELEKILNEIYLTDSGRRMRILVTGVDTGHYTNHAYTYIDNTKCNVVGIKGDKEGQYRRLGIDVPIFKPARERAKLYILDVNHIKDQVAEAMNLRWDPSTGEPQPPGLMNYPTPADGLYLYNNFFKHYESERRQLEEKDGAGFASRWSKKNTNDQNHFWDAYVYNWALKEIWATLALHQTEQKRGTWTDFVNLVLNPPK